MTEYVEHLSMLPEHMHDAIRLWITRGFLPGHFLTAVLCNDLAEACGRADGENAAALCDWVRFLYCYAPCGCWGSPEKVKAWAGHNGLARPATDAGE